MKKSLRIICLVLVVSLLLAVPVSADTGNLARGSAFFGAHDTYIYKVSSSGFQIWFDVTATSRMDKLGVWEIELDRSPDGEDWELIKTYNRLVYTQMLCDDTYAHGGYVPYANAISGYYYRAYVTFYAKDSTGSAKLFRYTAVVQM